MSVSTKNENIPFFAITTRGLEEISAQEINALAGVVVQRTEYRRVRFSCIQEAIPSLMCLRTVDDVFFHLADWNGIYHTRVGVGRIEQLSQALRIHPLLKYYNALNRNIPDEPTISVTVNFVGRRKYSTEEIKQAVASGVNAHSRWKYSPRFDESDLNLRLFLEHEYAVMGLRLSKVPLHRRSYKQTHLPGSLKPTIAAALNVLGEVKAGQRVLDPFCGAGTILIEAAAHGAEVVGGDISPLAIAASLSNFKEADFVTHLHHWDAQSLPLKKACVDVILTNPPWGGQIQADDIDQLYRRSCAEMRRVLKPGGKIVLLTESVFSEQPYMSDWKVVNQFEISVFGRTPIISVFEREN
ncbi:MAG: methyltransferase domain-containing protein [Anaerolineaceae bacterium]|nr:methyltransferase domain-containing protein [Anaerolineaceae bacterium]